MSSTVTAGPTVGPSGESRWLNRLIGTARGLDQVYPLKTAHACSAPVESRATAIDAGQSPVLAGSGTRRPSVTSPVVALCHPPPGSRQASCTPLLWRPWTTRSRPPDVMATWCSFGYAVASLDPV